MATRHWGVDVGTGADPRRVEISTSTTSKAIELVFDKDATGMSKQALHNGLTAMLHKLMSQPWPMA